MKLVIILSFAAVAVAQTNTARTEVRTGVAGGIVGPGPVSAAMSFATNGPGTSVQGIIGEPFSAEQITEHVQTLADGTRITQPAQKTMYYRDSQGRTRIEFTLPLPAGAAENNAPRIIEINDPVSGTHYNLDARAHVAHKFAFPSAAPPPPPPPPGSAASAGRLGTRAIAPLPAVSGPDAQRPQPQYSRESLGTQTIEGVSAEGSRMTVVYPVGFFGNDRPVTTVYETWMSPDLKMAVLTKTSDPRSGEFTSRLTNISRAEPDQALFQVPPDYQVIEPSAPAPAR